MENNTPNNPNNKNEDILPEPSPVIKSSDSTIKRGASKLLLLLVVLLLAGAGGLYYWMDKQNKDLKADNRELENKVQQLSQSGNADELPPADEDAVDAEATDADSSELATGNVFQENAESEAVVSCYVTGGYLEKLWVNYGTDPANLKQTVTQTNELGMGDRESFGHFSAVIPASELEDGRDYFYRCAGETAEGGKSVAAGLAVFSAKK